MRRPFLAFLLAFLLLGLQHEALVHAIDHLGDGPAQGATAPQEGKPCAKCELLASGANGLPAASVSSPATCADLPVAQVAFASRAVAAPACYFSRAPPAFS